MEDYKISSCTKAKWFSETTTFSKLPSKNPSKGFMKIQENPVLYG